MNRYIDNNFLNKDFLEIFILCKAGVVSFGHKCGQTHGVYTSVAKYENWIREVIKEQRVSPKNQKGLPCKSCCQFLKISGSDIQTSRQGFYEIQSQIEGTFIIKALENA